MSGQGIRYDQGKPQWHLMPWEQLENVIRVLMFGAEKYSPDNWKHFDTPYETCLNALERHYVAVMKGEHMDPESGTHHMAHVICNALFIMWHKDNE